MRDEIIHWGLECVGTQRTNPASAPYERTTGMDPTPSLQKAAGAQHKNETPYMPPRQTKMIVCCSISL